LLVCGLFGALLVPVAKADGGNLQIIVTVKNAVQLPGQLLAPGTYVWQFVDLEHQYLEVSPAGGADTTPLGFFQMVPISGREPADELRLDLTPAIPGVPQRITDFFYPGLYTGYRFQYRRSAAAFTAKKSKTAP
jgi:hypothetical protein